MELAELVRTAVVEDLKKNTRELIGKDDYKVGDISKAVDAKVKRLSRTCAARTSTSSGTCSRSIKSGLHVRAHGQGRVSSAI